VEKEIMNRDKDERSPFEHMFQIGVVVRDMDKAIERLTQLGLGPFTLKMPPPDAREMFRGKPFVPAESVLIKSTQMGNIELELIQPLKGDSPHKEYLDEKGEGIQHIAFTVDDLDREVEKLTKKGVMMLFRSDRKYQGGVAYLDLNAAGIIVELVKHPK
jgi:methylmalonyl-CoA/ethylmalonyl-CoA epimerase